MLQPGLQARVEKHTKNSSDRPARAKQIHTIPPHPAQHRRASPENPIAPFHTHSLSYPIDPSWMRAGGNPRNIPFPFAKAGFKDMVRKVCATHRLCLVSF